MLQTEKKERMQWVDCMRGFSMLLVVLAHVMFDMGIGWHNTFLSSLLITFRMPLFFFVSGFFSHKALEQWNPGRIKGIMKRKCQAQIIGTLVFMLIFNYTFNRGWEIYGFGGYWFTIVLFQMYCLYILFTLISHKTGRDIVIPAMVMVSATLLAIFTIFLKDERWFLNWENLMKYIQFFTAGIICSKYREKLFLVLSTNLFATIVITAFIIGMMLYYNVALCHDYPSIYAFTHDIAVRWFGLAIVVMFFYRKRELFSSDNRLVRALRFIGRRTLDIYFIHYFFVPNLSFLQPWLAPDKMLVVQLAIVSVVTILIVALSLLTSSILRQSDTLASYLFGEKQKSA